MSCAEVQALLSDSLDGGEGDETAAAAHLEGCADCARSARELSSIHRLMLEIRAGELLQGRRPTTKIRKRRFPQPRPSPWKFLLAAAAGLALAVVGYLGLRRPEPAKAVVTHPIPKIPALGTLEVLAGRVWRRSGGTEVPLKGKQDFFDGDGLRAEGRAVVAWNDGTRLELDGLIERLEESAQGKAVLFARGRLSAEVRPQVQPLVFLTPQGEARVLGTTLSLRVDPKATRLDVETGKVELRNAAGKAVLVEAGFYAVAAAGRELAARRIEAPGWQNATAGLGGPIWGRGGVTLLAAVPGRDEIIAGVHDAWLWSSVDGGASWRPLGGAGIRNMPHHLVFDPADSRTFWVSAIYGPGLFKTTDGGASFRRLGTLDHLDGLSVDFSDPARRTLLVTKHLDAGGLQKSTDGGETWTSIGERLPAESRSSSMPFILDAKTYLVDASGSFGKTEGLYRSADGGASWTRVSATLPAGPPLLASDGAIYWQPKAGMGEGLLKSVDRGLTWTLLKVPVKSTPVEIEGGRLVAAFEKQLFVSSDGGLRWEKFGEPTPVQSQRTYCGMTYEAAAFSEARRAIFVWRGSSERTAEAVFRWTLPE